MSGFPIRCLADVVGKKKCCTATGAVLTGSTTIEQDGGGGAAVIGRSLHLLISHCLPMERVKRDENLHRDIQ